MVKEIRQFAKMISEEQSSKLILIAARPFMGKTLLALHLVHHLITKEKKATAYFSIKLPANILRQYLFCIEANIETRKLELNNLSADDLDKMAEAAAFLYEAPLYIYNSGTFSVEEIREKALDQKIETGLDAIFIDYLQLLSAPDEGSSRPEEITEILKTLKIIAEELGVPVIVLSQLSRGVEIRPDKRPAINDLHPLGQVEAHPDMIVFLHSESYYDEGPTENAATEIIIAKNNKGKTGIIRLINFINYANLVDNSLEKGIDL